jgi:Kef-type K+ transport system membrane component KefB
MFDGLFVVLVVAALVPLRWASSRRSRSPGPLPRPGAGDGAGHCDRTVCARLGASSLLATSLVLVLPLLADAGQLDTAAGRLVVAGSSLGELTAVVLLSLLFSVKAAPIGGKLILFALLLILAALATIGLARADEPAADKHPQLIPVFFVNSGVTFDLRALTSHPATLARVPVFLAALLLVRGLPAALVYARLAGRRAAAGAGLLQSTSLPLIVAGTQVGLRLDQIRPANAAALVAAGLLSVVLFPEPGLRLLAADPPGSAPADSGQAKC